MADSLRQELHAQNEKFMALFATNNMAELSKLYTEDCKVMPSGSETGFGREAAANVFQGAYNSGVAKLVLEIEEVGVIHTDSVAYERSKYTFYGKDGSVVDVGKYVVVWKKVNNVWHLYTDIFNSNK